MAVSVPDAKSTGAGAGCLSLFGGVFLFAGLAAVDWVIPFSEDTPAELITAVLPDILVKGGDYAGKEEVVGWEIVEGYGGEVKVLGVVDSVSTTAIVNKIQEDN